MKRYFLVLGFLLISTAAFPQAGHIMQGVGAVNMSMGGAATGQPLDISGALHWNPAAISAFDQNIIKFDIGFFFSSPQVTSSLPANFMFPGAPAVTGTTEDDRGVSPMPALAMVWGSEESKHTFGASVFGISGFGVTFPQETNLPMDASGNPNPNWDPNNSNPINYPQSMGGFGKIQSDYSLLQAGFTWAYEISDMFSVGIEPTINYATLELIPNPTANPTLAGYPNSDKTSSIGFGGQVGVYFDSGKGFKAGAAYKSEQYFGDFEFDNTYLDNSTGTSAFKMNYPAIISLGVGYSKEKFDVALDYRNVGYSNTDGFSETGWTPTASVAGFGWENMSIVSAGFQFKGIEKLPLRLGYTYSSNPISEEVAFYNVPAPAIINHAVQLGLTFKASERISLDAMYHHGMSGGETSGQLLNPQAITPANPLGSLPGTSVSYEMTTDLIMVGVSYTFAKKMD